MRKMNTVKSGYFVSPNEMREIFFGLDMLLRDREERMLTLQNINPLTGIPNSLKRAHVVAVEAWKSVQRLMVAVAKNLPSEMRREPAVLAIAEKVEASHTYATLIGE